MDDEFQRLRSGYRTAGVILLNTVLLILLVNVVLGAYYLVSDASTKDEADAREPVERYFTADGVPVDNGRRTADQLEWYDFTALTEVEPEYAARVLDDFYERNRRGMIYQSWVQFSTSPYDGDLVHVDIDRRGFPIRRTVAPTMGGGVGGTGSSSPSKDGARVVRVFTLGGSTTFGENVSDEHTWPSYLEGILNRRAERTGYPHRIEVMNYGRGYYFPMQQTILLADLLLSGHRPSLVVSMDGVNIGGASGQPHFKPDVAEAFITRQHGSDVTRAALGRELRWIPMVRFALAVDHWIDDRLRADAPEGGGGLSEQVWEERIDRAIHRFEQTREMNVRLCELYGCRLLAFLQPNPLSGYNLELYRRDLPRSFTAGVPHFRRFYDTMRREGDYIDLSHLFREWGEDRKAILDDLHYTPAFNRFVARHVADRIELAELPVFREVLDEENAAAGPRSIVTREGWLTPEEGWSTPEGSR